MNITAPDWLTQRPIAHRGLHGEGVPENSLPAFEAAAKAGLPVELDVHRTSDGAVVVFHDLSLSRMCGMDRKITECTYAELSKFRLQGTDERIPLLAEALEVCLGRSGVLLEIKAEDKPGGLEAAVWEVLKGYGGDYAVQAFNPFSIAWFKDNQPQVARGQLASSYKGERLAAYKKFLLSRLFFNRRTQPHFVAYHCADLPNKYTARARKKGLKLLAWTVRTADEAERLKPIADNIIFEGFTPQR